MIDETKIIPGSEALTLVLGGTGKTGRRIATRLAQFGVPTRIGSRNADPSFDWADPTTWDDALRGVKKAYLSYAPDLAIPGATQAIAAFVKKAVKQGVQRLVLLSGRGEEEAQRCEDIVAGSGVQWTVVRAGWFAQNFSEGAFLQMVLNGEVVLPAGEVKEPFVDVEDIADVAVAALMEHGHNGQIYELTGPRLLTFKDAVAEITRASGRSIKYTQVPHEAFAAGIEQSSAPPDIAWLLDYLFATVLDGRNAYLCNGVKQALGREPTDFTEYAQRTVTTGVWRAPVGLPEAVAT